LQTLNNHLEKLVTMNTDLFAVFFKRWKSEWISVCWAEAEWWDRLKESYDYWKLPHKIY
jgi:hypothetical protein